MFTVNLGVFIREVAESLFNWKPKKAVLEMECCLRTRIGVFSNHPDHDLWWSLEHPRDALADEVMALLNLGGLPWLDRFQSRSAIVDGWVRFNDHEVDLSPRSRVDVAVILARQGRTQEAGRLLREHLETQKYHPSHVPYVHDLAKKLGIAL
jgi:hypothetical protein